MDNGDDCDDTDEAVNPDATEICDGVDNDCDQSTSEDAMASRLDGAVYTDITSLVSGTPNNPEAYEVRKDTVFCDGTFYVNLEITENVTVWGQNGADSTILDGAEEAPVVSILDDGLVVTLADLTLTNGGPGAWTYEVGGGGVLCEGSDASPNALSLSNMVVAGNIFPDATNYGAGVLGAWCDLDISGTEISNNYAYLGGGLLAYYSDVTMDGSSVNDNEASYYAAGLYQEGGSATYSDSDLSRNVSGLYLPIHINTDQAVDLDDVEFDDNVAAWLGGAAISSGSSITWDGSGDGTASATGNTDDGEAAAMWMVRCGVAAAHRVYELADGPVRDEARCVG